MRGSTMPGAEHRYPGDGPKEVDMADEARLIAACGLDCTDCDIRRAATDPQMQRKFVAWFKEKRNLDVNPETIRCSWCKGDRASHWSADCWILNCCVDRKHLEHCSDCQEFPCPRLEEWSKKSERYGQALARLVQMREARGLGREGCGDRMARPS